MGYQDALKRAIRIVQHEAKRNLSQTEGRLQWAMGFCDAYVGWVAIPRRDADWSAAYQRGYNMGSAQGPEEWEAATAKGR
jgi:hypothetical protein